MLLDGVIELDGVGVLLLILVVIDEVGVGLELVM